jgi:hypothetical protein
MHKHFNLANGTEEILRKQRVRQTNKQINKQRNPRLGWEIKN